MATEEQRFHSSEPWSWRNNLDFLICKQVFENKPERLNVGFDQNNKRSLLMAG